MLEDQNKQLTTVSPEIGHHIEKFEALNDLDKPPDFEEKDEYDQTRRRRRRRRKEKNSGSS